MLWRSTPVALVTSGAITLTIWARQPTRTRADCRDLLDLPLHVQVHGQVARAVVPGERGRVPVVVVERDAVDLVVALLEHLAIPDEVRRQDGVARAAGDELSRRVDDADLAGGVPRLPAVLAGRHV